jgi:hypothetical protein
VKKRDKTFAQDVDIGGAAAVVRRLLQEMLDECGAGEV